MDELQTLLRQIFAAVYGSNWRLVAALAVMALVAAFRKWGKHVAPKLTSGRWAPIVAALMSAALALANKVAAGLPLGGPMDVLDVLVNGALVGGLAGGIYSGVEARMKKGEGG